MKYLIFLLSFTVNADICNVTWNHDNQREDNTEITDDEMQFELRSFGVLVNDRLIRGRAREYSWMEVGACPTCEDLQVRAIDKNATYLKSPWITLECPPTTPVICQ